MAERRFIAPNSRESFEDYLANAGRVAVFVDAANVLYALRKLGWKMDYVKMYRYFASRGELVSAYFYIALFEQDQSRRNLLETLARKGFVVRSKPIKLIQSSKGTIYKGNCDVELTMDMVLSCEGYDMAILLSGDSDFAPIIQYLHEKGKQVVVISIRGHVGRELIAVADRMQKIDSFRDDWQLVRNHETPLSQGF